MKSSLKFREERCPLLRAKISFMVGAVPLSSGFSLGSSQDLAVHLGTLFPAGPSFKLAFKPNDPTPFSLILKTGLGLWGSPYDTPLSLTAEFPFSPKGGYPIVLLQVKTRAGNFGISKDVGFMQTAPKKVVVSVQSKGNGVHSYGNGEHSHVHVSNGTTHHKPSNAVVAPSALSNGDATTKAVHRRSGAFLDNDRLYSPSADSTMGTTISSKIEGFDKGRKGRGDWRQRVEGSDGLIVHVPDEILQEQMKLERQRSSATMSLVGVKNCLQGSRITAHSLLPLGSRTQLNIRWAIRRPAEFFHGWDGSLPSFSFSKLPSLLLDKVSFERSMAPVENPKEDMGNTGYLGHGLLPVSFVEENRELAQVAGMCYDMKRQLHLMYAENQVLRKAMEEMSSQVEIRGSGVGSWKSYAGGAGVKQGARPFWEASRAQNGREKSYQDVEIQKNQRDGHRQKDAGMDNREPHIDTLSQK